MRIRCFVVAAVARTDSSRPQVSGDRRGVGPGTLGARAAAAESSTVVVTHKVVEVARTTNRVVVLREGRVVLDAEWSGDGSSLQALCDRHLESPA